MLVRNNRTTITECHTIKDILKLVSYDTCLLLDIDNTIMEPLFELGSDQWFTTLINHACQLIPNHKEAIEMVIAIYQSVTHFLNTKVIEPEIIHMIKALQDIGIPVLALTARGHALIDTTFRQLHDIGIDLAKNRDPHEHRINLGEDSNSTPIFHRGIIFCDGKDKGTSLKAFLQKCINHPMHILMVDDKEKHLMHVAEAAASLGIQFDGLRYAVLDEKVKKLNMQNTYNQLAQIKSKLPNNIQHFIDRLQIADNSTESESKYSEFFVADPFKQHVPHVNIHAKRTMVRSASAMSFFSAKKQSCDSNLHSNESAILTPKSSPSQ